MIIEVKNLSYSISKKDILKNISFSLKAGGFYSVVGTNGSGKTTLLRSLSKAISIDNNKVFINNEDINLYTPKKLAKQIAVVSQHTETIFDFSAHQIVMMGRMPYQKRLQTDSAKDLDIVKKCMSKTNTWHLRNRSIKHLSGGELQRVMIARALTQQTPIILLDEPVSSLDIHHQFEIMELLKEINSENQTTIFIILHDLNLAQKYSNEIIVLKQGELVHFGKTKEILSSSNIEYIFEVNAQIENDHIILSKK